MGLLPGLGRAVLIAATVEGRDPQETWLATTQNRRGSQQRGGPKNGSKNGQRKKHRDQEGIIPVLARTVRDVENASRKGATSMDRARFQAIALLAREERARVRSDEALNDAQRDTQLKRLEGIAMILAQIAAAHPSFFELLAEDAEMRVLHDTLDAWQQAPAPRA